MARDQRRPQNAPALRALLQANAAEALAAEVLARTGGGGASGSGGAGGAGGAESSSGNSEAALQRGILAAALSAAVASKEGGRGFVEGLKDDAARDGASLLGPALLFAGAAAAGPSGGGGSRTPSHSAAFAVALEAAAEAPPGGKGPRAPATEAEAAERLAAAVEARVDALLASPQLEAALDAAVAGFAQRTVAALLDADSPGGSSCPGGLGNDALARALRDGQVAALPLSADAICAAVARELQGLLSPEAPAADAAVVARALRGVEADAAAAAARCMESAAGRLRGVAAAAAGGGRRD